MKTADDLIKSKTYQWCPKCIEATKKANDKHDNQYRYWPTLVERFSELHSDEAGRQICNYHGNPEFNPEHDCEVNDCG